MSLAAEASSDVDPKKLPPLPQASNPDQGDNDVHLVLDARLQGGPLPDAHLCARSCVAQSVPALQCQSLCDIVSACNTVLVLMPLSRTSVPYDCVAVPETATGLLHGSCHDTVLANASNVSGTMQRSVA